MPRKKYRCIRRPKRVCPYYRRAVSGSSTPVTTVTSTSTTAPVSTTAASVVTASQKKLSKSAFIDDEAKELCKCVDSIESLDSNENTGSSCESSGCESSSSDGSSGEESDECCSVVSEEDDCNERGLRLFELSGLKNSILSSCCCKECGSGPLLLKENYSKHQGLRTFPSFYCVNCLKSTPVSYTKVGKRIAINQKAVFAGKCAGTSYASMKTLFSILDLPPPISKNAYT